MEQIVSLLFSNESCDTIIKMLEEKKTRITNARNINMMRCIIGLTICSIVIVLTLVSLTLNIIDFYNETTPEAGLGTLRMYTSLSNILATLAAAICIPFQIDGLRRNKYKLPSWVVYLMFVGSVGTMVTMTIALVLIGPTQGYQYAMFGNSNLFMHTLNPLFIFMLFAIAISDVRIKFNFSFITIIPTFLYSVLYFIMAFVVKAWRDHYHLADYMPWPVAFILIVIVAFVLSLFLRFVHNFTNLHVTKGIEKYYKESDDYKFDKIGEAIAHLAEVESSFYHQGDDVYIPVDIIKLLSDRYEASKLPLDVQYDIYLENYLKRIKKDPQNNSK